MPMPIWWGKVNKRIFNPRAVASGKWPIISHVGRHTGATHRTPLDAHQVDGGYLFVLVYGSRSDWVQNILASGAAELHVEGADVALGNPRVVGQDEAFSVFPPDATRPPKMLRISEFLRMDIVDGPHRS